MKINSQGVSVNLKTYGKLLNHSDCLINLLVGALVENQIVKHDTKSIFYSNLTVDLLVDRQIDMQLNLSLIITKNFPYQKILKLDSITESYLCNILKSVEVRKAAGIDQILGKFLKDGERFLAKPISELCNLSITLGSFSMLAKSQR